MLHRQGPFQIHFKPILNEYLPGAASGLVGFQDVSGRSSACAPSLALLLQGLLQAFLTSGGQPANLVMFSYALRLTPGF